MSSQPTVTSMADSGGPWDSANARRGGLWLACLFGLTFFCSVAPTLTWTEFHDPVENLNIATALEMRRGGPWLVPTLQGQPRLAKPPLTAWITAASIRPATVAALNDHDPGIRNAAYERLTFEARWPALTAAALTLVLVYLVGLILDGAAFGLIAQAVCATTFLLLRHSRIASADIQLTLWVSVANAMIALAIVRGRVWSGCIGAGVALGLVLMSKGPVGLAQTLLPFGLFLLIFRRSRGKWMWPAIVGTIIMLTVGGCWYVWVAATHGDMGSFWFSEVTGINADDVPPGPWFKHFASLHLFFPWLIWLGAGAVLACRDLLNRGDGRGSLAVLALLLLLVPLVVMSFSKDRFERYVLPMTPAGALLAAWALLQHARRRPEGKRWLRAGQVTVAAHWALLAAFVTGFPIAAALGRHPSFVLVDGRPWFSPLFAAAVSGGGLVLIITGAWVHGRWRGGIVLATALLMLGLQAVYYERQGNSPTGQADLRRVAEQIHARYPDARLYATSSGHRNPISSAGNDLSIYLNRPITWASQAAAIPAADQPQIWFTTRPRHEGELPTPQGWELLARMDGGNVKYVFVRTIGHGEQKIP